MPEAAIANPSDLPLRVSQYCQKAIETGRTNALNLWVAGAPLDRILTELVEALETMDRDLKCSIMLLDRRKQTLHSLVGPALPAEYCQAISGIKIGAQVGACGASAFLKCTIIATDIQTDPNWIPFRSLCQQHNLRACWSQPILSASGDVLGTFGMYYSQPRTPSEADRELIAIEASIAGLIIERVQAVESLNQDKQKLEKQVQQRTWELTQTNKRLRDALEQRNEVQQQLLDIENLSSLGTMMSSLTHEINTPLGVAITALSHLQNLQDKSRQQFELNRMTRSGLGRFYLEAEEALQIVERNLQRSAELISTFKQLSLDQHNQEQREFNVSAYVCEILLSLKPRLKHFRLQFCLDLDPDLTIHSYPGAISQILINLIVNSMLHAFEPGHRGRIHLRIVREGETLLLDYRDDGKGMDKTTLAHIFEPFFTSAKHRGGSGLGMHICKDLVEKLLGGSIRCESSLGQGCRFVIRFPF
ncbi:sensor histidine kinase [Bowmanella dokdonensis]|uniref:histidine kinase n=1 Tax=Bowmanella dokdonensis TaxID=751969 RepID=A0A939IMU7_9ALTE|nr:GAF domain-containing sensor histidine kinase [Bowmanella dokdonensis]MBN7824175.1 GAF domain-containing sensor histidine kinase [Bowmanella dokdonensis]